MLFSKSSEKDLLDFIEKPVQECKEEELEQGVNKIIAVLTINSSSIIHLINCHEYISPVMLLDDLAGKMKKQNCLEKLKKLFDDCIHELIEFCIFNIHDMLRLINMMPDY